MRRREFIALISGSMAAWPLAAHAQQLSKPTIGYLGAAFPGPSAVFVDVFRQVLGAAGFDDGQNVTIEYLWAEGHTDRLPALAAEFVQRKVNLIAAVPYVAALAAKAGTSTIPSFSSAAPIRFRPGSLPGSTGREAT